MCARGYSQPLQRRITDFGADVPFAKISFKLKEHYGIEVPTSSAQNITETHALKIRENEYLETEIPEQAGVERIVVEMDGSMIPIVTTDVIPSGEQSIDRRKTRQVAWKEARLSLARPLGSVETVYEAIFLGGVDDAGDRMAHCAIEAGAGENTKIHCVSDGAPWIADQAESAHRYVIQERLKLAGAWWTPENAHNMLALRSLRANNQWESYWDSLN